MEILKNKTINQLYIGIFLVVLAILSSCKKEEIRNKDYLSGVTEVKIKGGNPVSPSEKIKEIILGQSVDFLVYHTSFDGCGIYSRKEINQLGNDIELTFYARSAAPSGVCTDNLKTIETEYKFTPKQTGTFLIKFRQQIENTYLIYTVVVR